MTVEVIDDVRFRDVLGHFSTGVVVITADRNGPVGMTAQSVVSLSLTRRSFCSAQQRRLQAGLSSATPVVSA
jgi:flavin reductase (DIM6/NTAB) family NADH-FMN oxidoreductase RutF